MRLLLTSAGFENESIKKALRGMVGTSLEGVSLAFIPTAANLEAGDKWWLLDDLQKLRELGFNIDIVDISALPKDVWQSRLQAVKVIFVEGGNTFHLMHWVRASGLADVLPDLLKTRIYVGVSAGSMIPCPDIQFAKSEKEDAEHTHGPIDATGVGLVDFFVEPHINSKWFSELTFEYVELEAKETGRSIYALDDQSAVKVVDGTAEVISEGRWEKFN